jgi:transposase-like protein
VAAVLSFPGFPDTIAEATLVAEGKVRMPAPHPPGFRERVVELARQRDKPIRQTASDLGISESCLRNWLARADAPELQAKSRHRHLATLGICVQLGEETSARITAENDGHRRRR